MSVLTPPPDPPALPYLLDPDGVADLMSCSVRQVWRMRDSQQIPPPLKLGRMVRWRRDTLLKWLDEMAVETRRAGQ